MFKKIITILVLVVFVFLLNVSFTEAKFNKDFWQKKVKKIVQLVKRGKSNAKIQNKDIIEDTVSKFSLKQLEKIKNKVLEKEEIGVEEEEYQWHENIKTTMFWVGEEANKDNGWVHNNVSAWDEIWVDHFGGVDDPDGRSFVPYENSYYFALPYSDYNESGLKGNVIGIPWYEEVGPDESLIKNRWIKIKNGDTICYGQWEDSGPFNDNDFEYVFGQSESKFEVGLDVSPDLNKCLNLNGLGNVDWQFVDFNDVPAGSWKEVITISKPFWY